MLIQTETTPNPATLKFLPGQKVMDAGTRDFATPEEAEASPLAEAIFSTGEPSLSANTFRVRASQVINNKSGLLFWGSTPSAQPFQGASKCVGSPVVRTPLQSSGGNPPPDDCSGAFVFHVSGAYMASHGLQAGAQVYCQYWSRDPLAFAGSSLTGGLAFLVGP